MIVDIAKSVVVEVQYSHRCQFRSFLHAPLHEERMISTQNLRTGTTICALANLTGWIASHTGESVISTCGLDKGDGRLHPYRWRAQIFDNFPCRTSAGLCPHILLASTEASALIVTVRYVIITYSWRRYRSLCLNICDEGWCLRRFSVPPQQTD